MKAEGDAVMASSIPLMLTMRARSSSSGTPSRTTRNEKSERTLPKARQWQAVEFIRPCRLMRMIVPSGHRLLVPFPDYQRRILLNASRKAIRTNRKVSDLLHALDGLGRSASWWPARLAWTRGFDRTTWRFTSCQRSNLPSVNEKFTSTNQKVCSGLSHFAGTRLFT
jgi:hypothetical protein